MTEQEKWLAEASKRLTEMVKLNGGKIPTKVVHGLIFGDISFEEADEYIKAMKKVHDFEMKYFKFENEPGFMEFET